MRLKRRSIQGSRNLGFDVVIRGGTVVDGTGAPPVKADIGISDDRITARKDVEVQGPTSQHLAGTWNAAG